MRRLLCYIAIVFIAGSAECTCPRPQKTCNKYPVTGRRALFTVTYDTALAATGAPPPDTPQPATRGSVPRRTPGPARPNDPIAAAPAACRPRIHSPLFAKQRPCPPLHSPPPAGAFCLPRPSMPPWVPPCSPQDAPPPPSLCQSPWHHPRPQQPRHPHPRHRPG